MSVKRKNHSANFKSKVALSALKGDQTISDLCHKFGVAACQIHQWRKQLLEGSSQLFERANGRKKQVNEEADLEKLYAEIGRLKVERDFLKKKLGD